MPRFGRGLLCAFSSLLVCACSADSDSTKKVPGGPPDGSATGRAYHALTVGEQDQVTQVIADVDDAVAVTPDDGRAVFYSAIMRFWQLGEEIDLPANPIDVLPLAQTMIDRFRTAQSMLPDDDRAPAFGGLAKVIIGNTFGDSAMHDEGMSDIEEGIRIFPAYSNFLRALASARAKPDSEDYAAVLPAMQAVLDACGAEKNAAGGYDYLEGTLPSALRPCNDEGIVPHVWEGFMLSYGDMLLKAGKSPDDARKVYESAKAASRFEHWPFAGALQDRIDHAADRAALYADSDASNDPKLWLDDGHICTGCHQDTP
jgi:hypothetical protein